MTVRRGAASRHWTLPVVLAIVCGLLAIASSADDRWHERFDYSRSAVAAGEWWRLVTAHLMHLSMRHAALDIAGLLLVTWIFGRSLDLPRQIGASVVGVVFVDVGLWFFEPAVMRYAGLSGVLHAWFVVGAAGWAMSTGGPHPVARRAWGALLLVGVVAKLALEMRAQPFWLDTGSMAVVTAAHRWGAAGGLLFALARTAFHRAGVGSRDR